VADNDWKQKYFDSLEELELREKRWAQLESGLRRTLSRLSFIGDGRSENLDQRLEQLRNRVRSEDLAALQRMVDGLVKLAENHARDGTGLDETRLRQVMSDLLQQADFPKPFKKRIAEINRRLNKESLSTGLMSDFGELFIDLQKTGGEKSGQSGNGMLSRLFNKQAPGRASDHAATTESAASEGAAQALDIFLFLLDALRDSGISRVELDLLHREVEETKTQHELEQLARQLSDLITPDGGARPEPGEVLLQLLQSLELAPDSQDESSILQAKLRRGVADTELPTTIAQIADLVAQLRQQAENEREVVESFLLQLSEQLRYLDSELNDISHEGKQVFSDSRSINEHLNNHVSGLHASVAAATDLNELKLTVSDSLSNLQERLRRHREVENRRIESF